MKHLTGVVLVAAVLAALTFAAMSAASTSGTSGAKSTAAAAAKLPALPSYVKARHKWVIGVKCDYVPFGYYDVQGNHRGYDVAIARRFATLAFGAPRKVKLVCVTTPSRIPTLQSSQVDMIISTLTWTAARTQVIDFSVPYYNATGRLLVPNNSPINSLQNLSGKTVVTTRGAIYATWIRNCFKSTNLLEVDGTAAAVLAVKEGRADTFMFDDALILGVAAQDPTLKLTNDKFLNVPWGIGLRKGDTAAVKWVNAAINYMRKRGEFAEILKANAPKKYWPTFVPNAPGPKTTFQYPVGKDPSADCTF